MQHTNTSSMSGATRRLANKSILSRDLGARAVAHDEERRALERFGQLGSGLGSGPKGLG